MVWKFVFFFLFGVHFRHVERKNWPKQRKWFVNHSANRKIRNVAFTREEINRWHQLFTKLTTHISAISNSAVYRKECSPSQKKGKEKRTHTHQHKCWARYFDELKNFLPSLVSSIPTNGPRARSAKISICLAIFFFRKTDYLEEKNCWVACFLGSKESSR